MGAARLATIVLALTIATTPATAAPAAAAPLPSDSIGINLGTFSTNGQLGPDDLGTAAGAGVGLARIQVIQGKNADPVFALAAAADLRVYPTMGLSQQLTPSAAASAMAQYVTAFAQRYGPNGSFWTQNPQLPYLPVQRYEIGNEPNMPQQWVEDETNLHWTDPAAYAQVYEAARAALHQVDPTGVAVVGGLADSGGDGVDVASAEQWLAALPAGGVDAVGFHMYLPSSASLEPDTESLRQWMDANGFQNVPLDVNEMGACDVTAETTLYTDCAPSISSGDWGAAAAQYAQWALCTPAMNVDNVQVEYWGDLPWTDRDAFLPLITAEGAMTPYGQDYLGASHLLTTEGCPPEASLPPAISGEPVVGQVVSATAGSWSPAATTALTYQWSRCDAAGQDCTSVPGAASPAYQVQSADVGDTLVMSVTAGNEVGTTTASSEPTAVVTSGSAPPANSSGSSAGSGAASAQSHPRSRHRRHPAKAIAARAASATVARLRRARFRVAWARARGGSLTVAVRVTTPGRRVAVDARRYHRHRRLRRMPGVGTSRGVLIFSSRLASGRWAIEVMCVARCGPDAPASRSFTVLMPRLAFRW